MSLKQLVEDIHKSNDHFTKMVHVMALQMFANKNWPELSLEDKRVIITQFTLYLFEEKDPILEKWVIDRYHEAFV